MNPYCHLLYWNISISANPQSMTLKDIAIMERSKSAGEDQLETVHATGFISDIYWILVRTANSEIAHI